MKTQYFAKRMLPIGMFLLFQLQQVEAQTQIGLVESPASSGYFSTNVQDSLTATGSANGKTWLFEAEGGDRVTVWVVTDATDSYPRLRLRNASNTVLASHDGTQQGESWVQNYTITTPGTYNLFVYSDHKATGLRMRVEFGRGYLLESEGNDSFYAASSLTVNPTGGGFAARAAGALRGDPDYFDLGTLGAGNAINISLGLPSTSTLISGDAEMTVFKKGAEATPLSTTTASTLNTTVVDAGEYFLRIRGNEALSGRALRFDGTDDGVSLGNPAALQMTGDQTIEMWIKPDDLSVRRNPWNKAYAGEGTMTIETGGDINYFYGTGGGNNSPYQTFNSLKDLRAGHWQHIALVRQLGAEPRKLSWYINGLLVNEAAASYFPAVSGALNALVGHGYAGRFKGEIDELRLWNVARTGAEIASNMDNVLTGGESGLVSYYKFAEGGGTTLDDTTFNGLDGTIEGSPEWTGNEGVGAFSAARLGLFAKYVASVSVTDATPPTVTGVTPLSVYGPTFEGIPGLLANPGNMTAYRGQNGTSFNVQVTASGGTVWGTDTYTDDSPVAVAALHAGLLLSGETGIVTVTILAGQASYLGTSRNGVSSNNYGSFPGSYSIAPYTGVMPTLNGIYTSLRIDFSERMLAATLQNPANVELRHAGSDGVLGNGNDYIHTLTTSYSGWGQTAYFAINDGPLQPGLHRLRVTTGAQDRSGNALADVYDTTFTVLANGNYITEDRDNDTRSDAGTISPTPGTAFDRSFFYAHDSAVGTNPHRLKLLDVTGDGRLDAVVAAYYTHEIRVFTGNADGSFAPTSTNYPTGNNPWDLELIDFDTDGDLDVVAVCYGSDQIRLHRNNGAGALEAAGSVTVGNGPLHLVKGHFNADARLDLAVANYETGAGGRSLSILLSNVSGSFDESKVTVAGNVFRPYGLAAGDVNNDGKADLVAGDYDTDDMRVFLGVGDGTFGAPTSFDVEDLDPTSVALADFDHDGDLDALVATEYHDYLSILKGNGDGTFQPFVRWSMDGFAYQYFAEAVDVDGDTWVDLVIPRTNGLVIRYNRQSTTSPTFTSPTRYDIGYPLGAAVADLNGDARPDIVVNEWNSSRLRTLLGNAQKPLAVDATLGRLRHGYGRGQIGSDTDEDWFSFTVDDAKRMVVAVENPGAFGSSGLYFSLFNAVGTNINNFYSDANGCGQSDQITVDAPGTYYVRVMQNYGYRGEYQFRVSLFDAPTVIESEGNDSIGAADATSLTLSVGSLAGASAGYISESDTNGDYWSLGNLGAGANITLDLKIPATSPLSARMAIFKSNGTQMAISNEGDPQLTFAVNAGDESAYYFRVYDGASTRGLHAEYLVDITIADPVAPTITLLNLPAEGGSTSYVSSNFSINYSEDMLASTVTNPASYELRHAGPNATFDNADDVLYTITPQAYTSGLTASYHLPDGPLQPGNYRFTAKTTLTDKFANPLATAYVRLFTVVAVPGFVLEDRSNDGTATADSISLSPTNAFDGSFSLMGSTSAGANLWGLKLLDLNGDGNKEAIVAKHNTSQIAVFPGNADGTFGTAVNYATGTNPWDIELLDIDGDSDLDVAVSCYGSDEVRLFANPGDGTLVAGAIIAVGDGPIHMVSGRFSNDAFRDLAVVNHNTGTGGRSISVLLGNGAGGFTESKVTVAGQTVQFYGLTVGNFDEDPNNLDDLAAGDFVSDDMAVFLNTGGAFAAPAFFPIEDTEPTGAGVADFDHDGNLDIIAVTEYQNFFSVLRGNGDGTFQPFVRFPLDTSVNMYFVETPDLNGDGWADVVVSSYGGVIVHYNRGDGTMNFSGPTRHSENSNGSGIDWDDVNHDGRIDLVANSYNLGQVFVWTGNSSLPLALDGGIPGMRQGAFRGFLTTDSDEDWYTFTAQDQDRLLITTENPGAPSGSGRYLSLYNSRGQNIGNFYTDSVGYGQWSATLSQPGRHYLRVGANYGGVQEYRVRVTLARPPTFVEQEDNNSLTQTNTPPLVLGAGQLTATVLGASIVNDGAGDYFSLGNLSPGTQVTLTVTPTQLAVDSIAARQELQLQHRWSFGESGGATQFTDSVTGLASAVLRGAGATVGGGQVVLPGGSQDTAAYIDLPNGIVSSRTSSATFEGWAAINGSQSWSRLFDFGTGTSGEITGPGGSQSGTDYLLLTAQYGGTLTNNRVEFRTDGSSQYADPVVPYNAGEMFHFAVAYDTNGSAPMMRYYRNGLLMANVPVSKKLSDLDDVNNWLGRGQYTDPCLNGAYSEFRVWNGAFSDAQAIASTAAGPDTLPAAVDPALQALPHLTLFKADGTQMAQVAPGSGPLSFTLAAEDAASYVFRVHNNLPSATAQYQVSVSIADVTSPVITSNSLPSQGATVTFPSPDFTLGFNEDMLATTVRNAANYELRCAGANGTFDMGGGDDVLYMLSHGNYTSGLSHSVHIVNGPLQPGAYRFTASTGLQDLFLQPMTAAHVREFTVVGVPGFVTEDRDNDSLATADVLSGASVTGAAFDGSYAVQPAMATGGNAPIGVLLIDLDDDEHLDMVISNRDSDSVTTRLNNGAGGFGPVVSYPVGDGPHYISKFDMDKDGDEDVVVPNAYSDNVAVLRNNSDGTLTVLAPLPGGDHPLGSATGDFNGDDNPDFVVTNHLTGTNGRCLSVYLGDGLGGFVHSFVGAGLSPSWRTYHVTVADFDGNNLDDIAAVNYDGNDVLVFLSTGAGSFAAPVSYATDRGNPTGIAVTDFNGDFKADLVVCYDYYDRVNILSGNGDGTFQPYVNWFLDGYRTQYNMRVGDLNTDGYPDLLAPRWGMMVARQNKATPALSFNSPTVWSEPYLAIDAAVSDLNGDGRRDMVVLSHDQNQAWVYLGQGTFFLNPDGAIAGMRHGYGRGQLDVNGEYDHFSFSARGGERLVVAAESPGAPGSSGFVYDLFNYRGDHVLGSSHVYGNGYALTQPYTVPYDGRYYLRVGPYYWSTAEYRFRVSIVDAQTQIEAEDNNSLGQANTISLTAGVGTRSAKVFGHHAPNDGSGDWFRLGNLAVGTDVNLSLNAPQAAIDAAAGRQSLTLRHRWSFGEAAGATQFADSVGSTSAQLRGAGAVVGGGAVSLPGGSPNTAAYIDLPNGIASSRTGDATFEGWVSINGSANWSRLFDFGTGNAGEITAPGGSASGTDYLLLTAQIGNTQTQNRVELRLNGGTSHYSDPNVPYTAGQVFHYAVVYDADGNGGSPLIRYYRDGQLMASVATSWKLTDLEDNNNWLGRSQFTSDQNLNGAYSEFRVWDGAFTDSEALASFAAGPDSLPSSSPAPIAALPMITLYESDGTPVVTAMPGSGPLHHVVSSADAYYFRVWHSARSLNSVYQINASLTDVLPPQVTGTDLPGEGTSTLSFIDGFTLNFNEDLLPVSVTTAANYALKEAGADLVIGSSDDVTFAVSPAAYSTGLTSSFGILNGPLPPGSYRLTVAGLKDTYGTSMSAPFVRNFTVSEVPGITTALPGNNTPATATPLLQLENPLGLVTAAGRGRRTSSGDTDYWSFNGTSGQRLTFDVELVGASAGTHQYWRIRRPNGTVIWEGNLGNNSQGGFIPLTLDDTGVFQIQVNEYHAWTSEYRFRVSLISPAILQLETEANNNIASADAVTMTTTGGVASAKVAGLVHNTADLDYFNLGVIPAGKTVFLSAALPPSSSFLPVVALYNASGVFMSEFNGSTGDGSAEVRINSPDTYFLLVRSTGLTGSYMSQYVTEVQVHETFSLTIPNLQVTAVALPPEPGLQSGSDYTYSFTVTNVGSADIAAQPWSDRLVLSQNQVYGDGDDIEVGVFPRNASLASGAFYTVSGPSSLPQGLVGNYFLIARTDIADQVDELVLESDNTTPTSATFPVILAPYPDIVVQGLGVTGPVANVFTVNWTLANTGNANAPDGFKERVRVVNTATGVTLLDEVRTPGVINAAASLARTAQVTTSAAGTYQVTVIGDANNDLFEHDGVSHATAEVNTTSTSFNILQYWTIAPSTPDPAKGSVSGGGTFLDGAQVSLTATPNTSTLPYQFVRWSSGGNFVSANANYVFTASADRNLVAEFTLATYQVAATVSPVGAGTVSGGGFYQHGSNAALTATAGPGYVFARWEESGSNIGASATLNLTVTGPRTVQAIFNEANPTHVVTTATNPAALGVTTGDGTFNNGQTANFSAPESVTQGDTEYLFSEWRLNGVFFGTQRVFSKTFSTLDNANMAFVAHYTSRSLKPIVSGVTVNYTNPIRAANDVRFTLTFDRPMNTSIIPDLALNSVNASTVATMPPGGTWQTSTQFQSAAVTFTTGNGGAYVLNASTAADTNGRVMAAADVHSFDVDVTPPPAPLLALTSSTGSSATVNWNGYAAPGDINGFRLYLQTTDYTNVTTPTVLLSVGGTSGGVRSFTFNGLQPDTSYYAAVVAVDLAGNANPQVTTLPIFLDSTVPPPVVASLTRPTPSTARVNWAGYNTSSLIGFQGFRVYREETPFTDVTGLTHVAQLAGNVTQHDLTPLDRTKTYHIAVVGYNRLNEFNPAVTPLVWTDPLAGDITADLTIGTAGADSTVSVLQSMTVKPGATLTLLPGTTIKFAAATGLTIEGALLAEGTPLRPINLTSALDVPGGSPARGNWNGITLSGVTNATRLGHLWVRYGQGVVVAGGTPVIGPLFAVWNQNQGLRASGAANINVANSFFALNDLGVSAADSAEVVVSQSVLKTNTNFEAAQSGGATLNLGSNWWGTTNAGEISALVQGSVGTGSPLDTEPVLAAGFAATGGISITGSANFQVTLASANATAFRLSENSLFPGVLWTDIFPVGEVDTFSPYPFAATHTLSAGGGLKTVYAQFRSITGQTSAAIPVNVTLITDGPTINTFNLVDGQTLTRPLGVNGTASAPLGMQNIQFFVDNVLLSSAVGGALNFQWDIRTLNPGPYRVKLLARDNAGNVSTREVNVNVAPAPPPAPVITVPANNSILAVTPTSVTGTAEPGVTVQLRRNGNSQGTTTATGGGTFSFANVPLLEGVNELIAIASDSIGTRSSTAVNVTLDSGPPAAVILDEPPVYDSFLGLQITWHFADTGERPVKYRVFWHNAAFTTTSQASGQSILLAGQNYTLATAPDGPLFIRVVGYDDAGNASALSNTVAYTLDRTAPVFTIAYDKSMPAGPGTMEIVITANEPLASTPLLTIRPNGLSTPFSVPLSRVSGSTYTASYNVTNLSARTGAAIVHVTGTDLTGNTFAGIPEGTALSFDVTPPTATLAFDRALPIKTVSEADPGVAVDVNLSFTLTLSEVPKPGTTPSLVFTPPIGADVVPTLSGSGLTWTGSILLTSSMGRGMGQFVFSSRDGRDNLGSTVTPNQIEIYNTEHPDAPGIPINLRATTLAGGDIKIEWDPVSDAQSYRIYRELGNTGVTPTVQVASAIVGTQWTDEDVPVDGIYRYAIRAFRVSIEGPASGTLNALSDRLAPDAPLNPAVLLTNSGVQITWSSPSTGPVPHHYNIYRNGTKIRTVNTPQPVFDFPTRGLHQYEIASSDNYGNESRTAPISFEFFVDAVTALKATVREGHPTELQWQFSDPAGVGYNVYRNGVKQNGQIIPIGTKSFTDNLPLPPDESVEYRVTAVDNQSREGAPRSVLVQPVAWSFVLNLDSSGNTNRSQTRYFDKYSFNIVNHDAGNWLAIGEIQVNRTLSGGATTALSYQTSLNIAAGDEGQVDVPVPGAQYPGQSQTAEIAVVTAPNEGGAMVSYIRSGNLSGAIEPALMLEMSLTDTPVAGGLADVKVRIHNRGYTTADIILGRQAGQHPGDLVVQVRNQNGVEVSRKTFNGVNSPAIPGLIIRPNGDSVVTLAAGASVEVAVDDVLVPIALAESGVARFYAEISEIRTGLGSPNERLSGPLTGTLNSNVIQTPYYGTVSTAQTSYSGDQAITITGQSIDRVSSNPQGNLKMKIGFSARGAVWYQDITSDANGNFSYDYTPFAGFAGELTIWATHPDVFDVLAQRTVRIYRLYVTPSFGSIRMSKNDHLDFTVGLINPADLPLTGLDITFSAYRLDTDGITHIPVPEITCDFQDGTGPGGITALGRVNANMRLTATAAAPDSAIAEIVFVTSEGASVKFTGDLELLQPVPLLSMTSPAQGFVDVTVNRGQIVSREITLTNLGTRALEDVELVPPSTIPWMQLNLVPDVDGNVDLPDIPVGGTTTFTVAFVPPPATTLGYFQDKVKIRGANAVGGFEFNIFALVSSNATGNASFHVGNFLDQDVPGASVRMKNTITGNEIGPFNTNASGDISFNGLTEGTWAWQVIAAGHSTTAGTVDIVADQTVPVEVVLNRSLVTVTFQVKPVPFTDRYEIVIEQTFLTFVPAPVLVLTPPKYDFGNVQPGFETTVIYELKNHGLIKTFDVNITGTRHGIFTLEPLIDFIPELLPQQVVQIPARIRLAENIFGEAGGCGDGGGLGGFKPPLDPNAPGTFGGPSPTLGGLAQYALGESACPSPSNLADFLNGIAAIAAMGGNGCFQSQQSGHLGTVAAVALASASAYQAITSLPSPLAPITSIIAGVAADLLQCAAGHFSSSGGGGGGGGDRHNSGTYNAAGNGCFTGETQVMLADGTRVPINQLRQGNVLRTGTDHRETAEIREVYELESSDVHLLRLRGESGVTSDLRVTGEHMVWKDGAGWTAARELAPGDWLHNRKGEMIEIVSAQSLPGRHPVFTLQLKGNNTFYAGGVLVQDLCGGRYLDAVSVRKLKPVGK
jgi:hypothetical protein